MKRLLYIGQVIFIGLTSFFLVITLLSYTGKRNPLARFDYKELSKERHEEFDPALSGLSSMQKIEKYCDSIYQSNKHEAAEYGRDYSEIVSEVIRKRFYHGYSYYGVNDNCLAFLFSKITIQGYSATVIPDDILKHQNAACSQQSIVMMELLRKKGVTTRKVGFTSKFNGGHFCVEVFYDNAWHFYDPNMEPDANLLSAWNRPDIAYLVKHTEMLLGAYHQYTKEYVMDVFPNYFYGTVNKFPAPNAIIFQKVTKFLSGTLWLFFLVCFLLIRKRYKKFNRHTIYVRNRRIYFPQPGRTTSPTYYPELTTPGT
jgi:hypothetical protein